jgi:outer membrane protein TolC
VTNDWLKSFNDPVLNAIVAEAIANNPDLRAAAAKVAIAQQTVIVVGSRLLPWVGVPAGRQLHRRQGQQQLRQQLRVPRRGWELDVWGRLRAQRAASEANAEAAALDYAYARQSLAATPRSSGTSRSRRASSCAERAGRDDLQRSSRLVQFRRNAGKDSDLDVVDVRAKLEAARSDVERARESYGEARRALEVLIGRYPAAEIEVAACIRRCLRSRARASVRAARARPDLLAAEREVLARFARKKRRSSRCSPTSRFSLAGGRLGDQVLSLLRLNPWLVSVGIGVSIPIYEGGALRAKIQIATAQQAQAIASYGAVRSRRSARSRTASPTSACWRCNCPSTRSRSRTAPSRPHRNHPVQGGSQGSSLGGAAANRAARERIERHQASRRTAHQPGAAVSGARRSFDAAPPTVISSR